jgi:hypothetical protein
VVVSPEGQTALLSLPTPPSSFALELSPRALYLAYTVRSASAGEKLNVLNMQTGEEITFTSPAESGILNFVFAPDDQQIAWLTYNSTSGDWLIESSDIASGLQRVLISSADYQKTPARADEGETLIPLALDADGRIYFYSVLMNTDATFGHVVYDPTAQSWRKILDDVGHERIIGPARLSPGGRRLAYIAEDARYPGYLSEGLLPLPECHWHCGYRNETNQCHQSQRRSRT